MKVYIATSWKNEQYKAVMSRLQKAGHDVLDWSSTDVAVPNFRELDPRFEEASKKASWTPDLAKEMLSRKEVTAAYRKDISLLELCHALVLLTPCGRNAHFEAGFAIGSGKPCAVFMTEGVEPELMTAGMHVVQSTEELLEWLKRLSSVYAIVLGYLG